MNQSQLQCHKDQPTLTQDRIRFFWFGHLVLLLFAVLIFIYPSHWLRLLPFAMSGVLASVRRIQLKWTFRPYHPVWFLHFKCSLFSLYFAFLPNPQILYHTLYIIPLTMLLITFIPARFFRFLKK